MEGKSTPLDDYFNGLLNAEARAALLQRAQSDPELAEEFALREKMEDWLRAQPARTSLAENLSPLGAEFFPPEKPAAIERPLNAPTLGFSYRKHWVAAAAALAVLLAAIFFFRKTDAPLYEQFAQHAPLRLTMKSGGPAQLASEAESDFNAGKYADALPKLEKLCAEKPDDLTLQLHRAICLTELNRCPEAEQVLKPMAEGGSILKPEAKWYLALNYLRQGDLARCRSVLESFQEGEERRGAARRLLKELK